MTAALPVDGLGHVGVQVGDDEIFYNGNKLADFGDAYGLKRLGIVRVSCRACRFITTVVVLTCPMTSLRRKPESSGFPRANSRSLDSGMRRNDALEV